MSVNDPELPEILRMDPPKSLPEAETTLQRSMSLVSIEGPQQEKPPTQVMSVSDEELDWAEQMQRESANSEEIGIVSFVSF